MPNPLSTKEAKAAKFEGAVLVEGVINLEGRITNTRVIKSPGLGLDDSVIQTLKTWRCVPAVGPWASPFRPLFLCRSIFALSADRRFHKFVESSINPGQHFSRVDVLSFLDVQALHFALFRRANLVLHFHGFYHHDALPRFDLISSVGQ